MKCKICGHRTTTLNAMRKHYQQKHPSAMKRRKRRFADTEPSYAARRAVESIARSERGFCPHCGARL